MKLRFNSAFASYLKDYIDVKISHSFSAESFAYLLNFDAFLIENNYSYNYISKEIMNKWSMQRVTENKNTRSSRVGVVKQFCMYLVSVGVEAYIPNYQFSKTKPVPYVMTRDEIILFFRTLDTYFLNRAHGNKNYDYAIPVIFRILYTCGLRNNEACSLTKGDVLYDKKALFIKEAKNYKDRIVYLSEDVFDLIVSYIIRIEKSIDSIWLFPSSDPTKHIHKATIDDCFSKTINICSIGSPDFHPVPHSLRHSYVVHRVESWIKEGNDLGSLMPYLSKQLGHSSIENTYYYYHNLVSSYDIIKEKDRNLYPEASYEEL